MHEVHAETRRCRLSCACPHHLQQHAHRRLLERPRPRRQVRRVFGLVPLRRRRHGLRHCGSYAVRDGRALAQHDEKIKLRYGSVALLDLCFEWNLEQKAKQDLAGPPRRDTGEPPLSLPRACTSTWLTSSACASSGAPARLSTASPASTSERLALGNSLSLPAKHTQSLSRTQYKS